jgi:superfamily I DNA/RNA helicase
MPSDLGAGTSGEIEDERRLLYVAMTCAKDDLHLVVQRRFAPEAGVAGNSLRYEGNADDERSAAAGGRNLTE